MPTQQDVHSPAAHTIFLHCCNLPWQHQQQVQPHAVGPPGLQLLQGQHCTAGHVAAYGAWVMTAATVDCMHALAPCNEADCRVTSVLLNQIEPTSPMLATLCQESKEFDFIKGSLLT